MADNTLNTILTGDSTSLMSAFDKASAKIHSFATDSNKAVSQLTNNFGGLTSAFSALQGPILAITSILGGGKLFKDAISETVEFAKETGKLQRVLGGTSKDASVMAIAIGDIYGDIDAFLSGASKVTKTLNKSEEAITKLGVQTRDANGNFKDTPTLIAEINVELSKYKEGTDRNIEAQKIYGKSYQDMLKYINLTPEVLEDARKKVEELGLAFTDAEKGSIKQYRAAMNDVGDTLQAMKVRIGIQVMPALTTMANWFSGQGPSAIKTLVSVMVNLVKVLDNTVVQILLLTYALYTLGNMAVIQTMLAGVASAIKMIAVNAVIATTGTFGLSVAVQTLSASLMTLLLSPIVLIGGLLAALVGVSMAAQSYSGAAATSAEATKALAQEATNSAREFATLEGEAEKYENRLKNTTVGTKAYDDAKKGVNNTVAKVLELYPDMIGWLKKEDGSYVNTSEAMEKYRKSKIKLLEIEIELSKDRAGEARKDKTDALNSNWLTYGVVYKGVADNAEREEIAHEGTTKELQRQLSILKGQEEAKGDKRSSGGTGDGKTKLAIVKEQLEREKYEYERATYEKGQLLEYSKAQEVKFLESTLSRFSGTVKERKELERMLYEAKRAVMSAGHKGEMDTLNSSLALYKDDAAKRMEIAKQMEAKAKNPEERRKALDLQNSINNDMIEADRKYQAEKLAGERQHAKALIAVQIEEINTKRSLGLISETEAINRIKLYDSLELAQEKQILQEKLLLAGGDKAAQQKIRNEIIALEDAHNAKLRRDNNSLYLELRKKNPMAGLRDGARDYLKGAEDSFTQFKGYMTKTLGALESGISSALTGMLTGQMTFGEAMKSIWTGISTAVIQCLTDMIAKWAVAAIAQAIFGAETEKTENTKAAAALETSVAETFSAYASTPYVGMAFAAAQIAMIFAGFGAAKATAAGLTAYASGGYADKPTPGIFGEAGPEYMVPEKDMKSLLGGLISSGAAMYGSIVKSQARVDGYAVASSGFSSNSSSVTNRSTGLTVNINNAVIGDKQKLGAYLKDVINTHTRINGSAT